MLNGSSGAKHSFIHPKNTRKLDVYSLGLADNLAMVSTHQKGRMLGADMRTLSGSVQESKILDRFSSLTQQDIKLEIEV